MPVKILPKEISDHKNEWVALSFPGEEEIVASGKKPEDAVAAALLKGYGIMDIILLWVPDRWPNICTFL